MKRKKKGIDLIQSYDKSPYTRRTIQKATRQHKKRNQNFDYTTIAGRLRTVSLGNDNHQTGVVKMQDEEIPRSQMPKWPRAVS